MAEHTDQGKGDDGGGEEPEYEDIMGDCTILVKRIVINKNISPNVGEKVTIKLKRDIPELGKSFPEEEVTFTLGDGDVEQAVELVTSLMKLGEKFSVIAGFKYMYGEFGQEPDVPPKANFKFDIELMSNAGIVDYPNMDFDTRFDEAKKKKERGNVLFRRKDFPQALNLYQTACKIVDRDLGFDYPQEAPEKHQEVLEFRAVILCNTSAGQIRLQMYDAAILSAREATKICPSYSKAFYRLGQAYERNGLTEETATCYRKALALHEGDGKIKLSRSEVSVLQSELARLTVNQEKSKVSVPKAQSEKKQQAKTAEKQMYSKMFGNSPSRGATSNGDATSKATDGSATTDDLKDKNSGSRHDKFVKALARWTQIASHSATAAHENPITPASLHTNSAGNIISQFSQQIVEKKEHEKEKGAMAATDSRQMDPDLLWKLSQKMVAHIPHLEEDLQKFKDSLVAEMRDKEAVAMATTFLLQLGMESRPNDPKELAILDQITRRISDMIPNNIRSHVEDIAGELAKEADAKYKQDQGMETATEACMEMKNSEVLGHETYSSPSFTRKMVHVWEKMIKDSIFSPAARDTREDAPGKLDMRKLFEKNNMQNKEATFQNGYSGSLKKHLEDTPSDISDLLHEIVDPDDLSTGISDLVDPEDTCTDISDLIEETEDPEDTVSLDMSDLFDEILEETEVAAASDPYNRDSEGDDEIEFSTSTFVGLDVSETAAPDLPDEDLMESTEKENGRGDSTCNDGFLEKITHETNVAAASDHQNGSYVDDSAEKISAFIDGLLENVVNDTRATDASELQNEGSVNGSVRGVGKEDTTTHGVQEELVDSTEAADASIFQNGGTDTQRKSVDTEILTTDVLEEIVDGTEIAAASDPQADCSVDDSARKKFEEDTFSNYVLLEDIEDDTEASASIQNEDSVNDSDIDIVEEDSSINDVSEEIVDDADTASASGCQIEGSVDDTEIQNPLLEESVDDTGAAACDLQNDSEREIIVEDTTSSIVVIEDDTEANLASEFQKKGSVNDSDSECFEDNSVIDDVPEEILDDSKAAAADLENEGSVDDSDIEIVEEEATTNYVQEALVYDEVKCVASDLQNEVSVDTSDIEIGKEKTTTNGAQEETGDEAETCADSDLQNDFLVGEIVDETEAPADSDVKNKTRLCDSEREIVEKDTAFNLFLLEENEDDTEVAAAAAASDVQNEVSVDDSDREIVEEDSTINDGSHGSFGVTFNLEGNGAAYIPTPDLHQEGMNDAVFTISLHFQGDKTSNASFVQDPVTEEESAADVWDLKEVINEDTSITTIPDLEQETLGYPSTTASDISTVPQSEASDCPDLEPHVIEDMADADLDIQHEVVKKAASAVAANLPSEVLKDTSPATLNDLQSRTVEVKVATAAHRGLQTRTVKAGALIAAPHDLQKQVTENLQSRGFADYQRKGKEATTVTAVPGLKEETFKEKATEACGEYETLQKGDFEGASAVVAHHPHRIAFKNTTTACDSTTPRESSVDPEGYFTEEAVVAHPPHRKAFKDTKTACDSTTPRESSVDPEGYFTEEAVVAQNPHRKAFKDTKTACDSTTPRESSVDPEGYFTEEAVVAHPPHRKAFKDTKTTCDSTTPRESSVDPEGYFAEEAESTPDSSHSRKADADQAVEAIVAFPAMNNALHEIPWYWMAAGVGGTALAGYCIYKYARK